MGFICFVSTRSWLHTRITLITNWPLSTSCQLVVVVQWCLASCVPRLLGMCKAPQYVYIKLVVPLSTGNSGITNKQQLVILYQDV